MNNIKEIDIDDYINKSGGFVLNKNYKYTEDKRTFNFIQIKYSECFDKIIFNPDENKIEVKLKDVCNDPNPVIRYAFNYDKIRNTNIGIIYKYIEYKYLITYGNVEEYDYYDNKLKIFNFSNKNNKILIESNEIIKLNYANDYIDVYDIIKDIYNVITNDYNYDIDGYIIHYNYTFNTNGSFRYYPKINIFDYDKEYILEIVISSKNIKNIIYENNIIELPYKIEYNINELSEINKKNTFSINIKMIDNCTNYNDIEIKLKHLYIF